MARVLRRIRRAAGRSPARRGPQGPGLLHSLGAVSWRGLSAGAQPLRRAGFWRGLAALGLVGALAYLGIYARAQVSARPEFGLRQLDLVGEVPIPGRVQLVEMLQELEPAPTSFDAGLVATLGRRIAALPWVARLESCERVFPDRLRLRLTARSPVAVLVHHGRRYLLDAEGRWLPEEIYAGTPGVADLPAVVGVAQAPRAQGTPPRQADLQAALSVLAELVRTGLWTAIAGQTVDVGRHARRGRSSDAPVIIWTRAETAIEWGNAPGEEETHEPRLAEKLERLRGLLQDGPALATLARLCLQFDEVSWTPRVAPADEAPPGGAGRR